ncbi:MAG TPA: electron transport complex subunit RsxA [Clostridiales bacterium]|jgi:electron transport complex protein RnfA|nr:electron transport complex subunit RsxA [Clostridiales bacterium]HCG36511.1 electron transport complex subunit RsxA [Clostridiales bacterium]
MNVASLLLLAFTAIVVENFIFSQFYGICPFLGVSNKPSTAFGMGMAVTCVITLSSFLTWLLYHHILDPLGISYLSTIAFIVVIAALVQLIEMFLKKYVPVLYEALGIYLPLITTNCAVLGSALINIQNGYNLMASVVFGFSSALGFTMAMLIFAGVRERLVFADPPKSFEGLPILLVSAGLVAMAFAGFSGVNIG